MNITTYGWIVLFAPLTGAVLIGLTFRALPQRIHGILGTLAIFVSFLSAVGMFLALQDRGEEEQPGRLGAVGLRAARSASTPRSRS